MFSGRVATKAPAVEYRGNRPLQGTGGRDDMAVSALVAHYVVLCSDHCPVSCVAGPRRRRLPARPVQ
jgi:hypothetical protein